LLYNRKKERSR